MTEKISLKKDRIITLCIFLLSLILFSVAYFIFPMDIYKGEFISDYSFVDLISAKERLSIADFFYSNSFYGKFLSNFLVFINVSKFSYSLPFIKIANYVVVLLSYVVSYFLFWDKKISDKKEIFSIIFLVLLSTNFVNVYDVCSLIDAKIVVLVALASFLVIKFYRKTTNDLLKFIFLSLAAMLQILSFFIPLVMLLIYFIVRNDAKEELVKQSNYIFPSALLIVAAVLNYEVFPSLSLKEGFDFSLFFSSAVMPINRIIPTDPAATFTLAFAIFGAVVIGIVIVNELLHKRFINAGFFGILIAVEILSFKRHEYHLSKLYQINTVMISYFVYRLLNDEKPQFSFFKFFKGKAFDSIKHKVVGIGTGFKQAVPLLITTVYLVTSGVAVAFLAENKNIRDEYETTLGYLKKYDNGLLDNEASYFFDIDRKDFGSVINPYLENGYMSINENPLSEYEGVGTFREAKILRGIRKDDLKVNWLQKNFSFEINCSERFMTLSLYSIIDANNLSIYCNNEFIGKYGVMKENNTIDIDLKDFMNQQVVISGVFEKGVIGPFEKDVKYSSELLDLEFSNSYGIYGSKSGTNLWCNKNVGFFYEDVDTNKMFSFYNPTDETNACSISINGNFVRRYILKPGPNEIMLNMIPYYGKDALVNFSFDHTIPIHVDNKPIFIMFNGVVSNKNDGIYPANPDGLVWCNNNFTFYYDEKYTGESRYRTYKFYVPEGVEDNPVRVYVNGAFVKEDMFVSGANEIVLDLLEFKDQVLNVRFQTDDYIRSSIDNRQKTCVFQGEEDSDSYGIASPNGLGYSWCSKRFGFFYRGFQTEYRYRKYLFYNHFSEDNHIKVFVNGNLFKETEIRPGNNELILDLLSFNGTDTNITFEFEKANKDGSQACVYNGYSDSDFYGLKSDSFNVTNNWCSKEFAFYIKNLSLSGKYRSFNFFVPEGVADNPLQVMVDGNLIHSSFMRSGQNEIILDLYSYVGRDIELKFVLENALPANGNNKDELTCIYQNYSDSNVYGLNPGQDHWCKKEFALFYENLEMTARYRSYFFFAPGGTPDNPYKVYINGVLFKEGVMSGGDNEITLDLYSYVGSDVEVKFVFENQIVSVTDKRELVAIYKGFADKNSYGLHNPEPSGSVFTKKNFGFVFNNVESNKKFKFYMPESVPDNPAKIYVNGVLFLETYIREGLTDILLDLSDYAGTDVSVAFTLENIISGPGEQREIGSLLLGVDDVPFEIANNN